jgi:hypothetical protein
MPMLAVLACFAFLPGAQGQLSPPPDGCYPNFTTAEGCNALSLLTTGAGNTALGWRSLFSNTDGSFNTGVGGGALVLNNGSSNTAVGAAALLLNTTGGENTAVGTDALVFNDSGTGDTAIGSNALMNSVTTSNHVCVGRDAGNGITSVDNNIILGHHSGVHSVFGQVSNRCFIDNIHGAPVSGGTAAIVLVDADGRLGTSTSDGTDAGGFSPKGIRPQAIPDAAKQAMLELTVHNLQATVAEQRRQNAQQQKQIETLTAQLKEQAATFTAQLKEQAAQIQKVSAQLEMSKPTPQVVTNKP